MDHVPGAAVDVLETPCKVNLYLGVHHGRDERGYHRVDSLMVPVSLYDTVEVADAPALVVHHDPAIEVPAEKSTVWRAVTLLADALGVLPRVRVDVRARIPERAGLGGSLRPMPSSTGRARSPRATTLRVRHCSQVTWRRWRRVSTTTLRQRHAHSVPRLPVLVHGFARGRACSRPW